MYLYTNKQNIFTMCYENEFCIDQWREENGYENRKDETRDYKEMQYDRDLYLESNPDIIGGLEDTADKDLHDAFLQENADRVQRYITKAVSEAKENGEDPIEAAHQAVSFYDEYGLSDTEIEEMIEKAINPPPKMWTIGFRLNGDTEIKTHTTTAKDGLAAWVEIKEFYESGGDKIFYAYTA